MSQQPTPLLIVKNGLPTPMVVPITRHMAILGKHPSCDIVLPNPYVSRHHARIDYGDRGWTIADLGSKNGTFVNGQRISNVGVVLGDKDRIDIGINRVVLEFQAAGQTMTIDNPLPAPPNRSSILRVDLRGRQVWIGDALLEPALTVKEFDILTALYAKGGGAVTRAEIARAGWPERRSDLVTDAEIRQYVSRLRKRVEDDPGDPKRIKSLHGYGYRLTL